MRSADQPALSQMDETASSSRLNIFSEATGRHIGLQIVVRCRDNPQVYTKALQGAYRPVFPLLQNSQEFYLEIKWQITDLIKERGTAICLFDQ